MSNVGASGTAFPATMLRSGADAVMYADSMRTLEALERRLDSDGYVAARVERAIAASGNERLTLEHVAAREGLSTRSLIRRLRGAGTTYQELLESHLQERARTLLRNTDFDIAEIAYRLGYGDPANFGRACRRWFGMAPGQYRRQLLEG